MSTDDAFTRAVMRVVESPGVLKTKELYRGTGLPRDVIGIVSKFLGECDEEEDQPMVAASQPRRREVTTHNIMERVIRE